MTLPKGSLVIVVPVEVNLSETNDAAGTGVIKPLSLAPDIWYGVMDKLTVGVVHSTLGQTGFFVGGAEANGVCVTGKSNGCGKVYDSVGVQARYGLLSGSFPVAVDVGGFARSFDPLTLSAKVGITGLYPAGPLSIIFSPNIFIGVTERDANKEQVQVPVTIAFALGGKASLGVQSGITSSLDGFADNFIIPLAAGIRFIASPKLTIDGAFSFPGLYTKPVIDGTVTEVRTATLAATIAL